MAENPNSRQVVISAGAVNRLVYAVSLHGELAALMPSPASSIPPATGEAPQPGAKAT